jgi:DNA processing protein
MHDDLSALRRARAYLLRVAEPPAPALSAFIDAHGPLTAMKHVQSQRVPAALRHETAARHHMDLVDDDHAAAAAAGGRLVIPEDDEWPTDLLAPLARLADAGAEWATPPIALWTQAATPLHAALQHPVAIIGARAATAYGLNVAADFAYRLAGDGHTIVAGAAFGIDYEAHRAAIAADGLTVAVIPTGLDVKYPRGNEHLLTEIGHRGVVVSEYPPGTPPARHRFLARNRLTAALSRATVVVEAGARSGSLNTARSAAAMGRTVMAVPGPITSAASTGCHSLLRAGTATLAASIAAVREALPPT